MHNYFLEMDTGMILDYSRQEMHNLVCNKWVRYTYYLELGIHMMEYYTASDMYMIPESDK